MYFSIKSYLKISITTLQTYFKRDDNVQFEENIHFIFQNSE
jgi:hypothetical protein